MIGSRSPVLETLTKLIGDEINAEVEEKKP